MRHEFFAPVVKNDLPIHERIECLKEAIRIARYNAAAARRDGDTQRSNAAFDRAYGYVNRIRILRDYADVQ